jgi:hypothetical protein
MISQAITHFKYRTRLAIQASVIVGICLAAMIGTPVAAADPDTPQPPPATGYLPSISDFMIATIQPRHIRLWLSAQARNWKFAGYELGNLKGAFNRLGRAHPVADDIPLQDMIGSVTQQPFADLEQAIKSKDQAAFSKAYSDLTSGCNACHQATNHGVIVIKVPQGASVFDLDLTPTTP